MLRRYQPENTVVTGSVSSVSEIDSENPKLTRFHSSPPDIVPVLDKHIDEIEDDPNVSFLIQHFNNLLVGGLGSRELW